MENLEALRVPSDVFKHQRRVASGGKGSFFFWWFKDTPVIAAKVQMMLLDEHRIRKTFVLGEFAAHPSLLPRTQRELLKKPSQKVVDGLAGNPAITDDSLALLLNMELRSKTFEAILCNPGVSRAWREKFFKALLRSNRKVAERVAWPVLLKARHLESDEPLMYARAIPGIPEEAVLVSGAIPFEERQQAFENGSEEALTFLASNSALTFEEQDQLLARRPDMLHRVINWVDGVSPRVLKNLVEDGEESNLELLVRRQRPRLDEGAIRRIVARKPETMSGIILRRRLILSPEPLPEDVLRHFFSGADGYDLKKSCAARADLPVDLFEEALAAPHELDMAWGLGRNPQLSLDEEHPLHLVVTVAGLRPEHSDDRLRWDEVSVRNRERAREILSEAQRQVRSDFWDMFAGHWEGSVREFIDYARVLDA